MRCIEDLRSLPLLTKDDIRTHRELLVARDHEDDLTSSCTSGSTGSPLSFWVGPRRSRADVAARIRALLDAGARPEGIGVVARDLRSHGSPLRLQLDALGVPFSTLRARGPLDGPARRVRALCDLLAQTGETPADRWLDAVSHLSVEREDETVTRRISADLRLGLLRSLLATRPASQSPSMKC